MVVVVVLTTALSISRSTPTLGCAHFPAVGIFLTIFLPFFATCCALSTWRCRGSYGCVPFGVFAVRHSRQTLSASSSTQCARRHPRSCSFTVSIPCHGRPSECDRVCRKMRDQMSGVTGRWTLREHIAELSANTHSTDSHDCSSPTDTACLEIIRNLVPRLFSKSDLKSVQDSKCVTAVVLRIIRGKDVAHGLTLLWWVRQCSIFSFGMAKQVSSI